MGEDFFVGHGMIDLNVINDGTSFKCGLLDYLIESFFFHNFFIFCGLSQSQVKIMSTSRQIMSKSGQNQVKIKSKSSQNQVKIMSKSSQNQVKLNNFNEK